MHLVIGLGPIGGNIGSNLAEKGREAYGYDLDTAARAWWSRRKSMRARP